MRSIKSNNTQKSILIAHVIDYVKANYIDVRVIGYINPSVVITQDDKTYVIYKIGTNKYMICSGENRIPFEKPSEIKNHIKHDKKK